MFDMESLDWHIHNSKTRRLGSQLTSQSCRVAVAGVTSNCQVMATALTHFCLLLGISN